MKICENCLCRDVCALHEDNFMEDAIRNGFCGKFKNKEHYVHVPCKIGDTVWDKEGIPYVVQTIEQFPNDIHLHCERLTSHERKTLCIGKRSIGRSVFLTPESFLKKQKELAKKGNDTNE